MNKLKRIFRARDLRNKILVVVGILVVFRFLASVPVPGVDVTKIKEFFSSSDLFGALNVLSGSAMSNFSIVMLGVGPYISASIIMQLMTMIIPQVKKWYREEGEAGRQKFHQITRLLTLPLAVMQGIVMLSVLRGYQVLGEVGAKQSFLIVLTITAGTIFLMWLGEIISEKGIGNGVSLLIFAGIIADLPSALKQLISSWDESRLLTYAGFGITVIAVIYLVVFITEGQRNIPISYARRLRGSKSIGGNKAYLPLRINQAGVIPIIFASPLVAIPPIVAQFIANKFASFTNFAVAVANIFSNYFYKSLFLFLLVVAFTFFYTKVAFEPKNIAENLQKNGGYIPGIRPGKSTEQYLDYLVNRITLFGAVFLGLIAVLPSIVQWITKIDNIYLGGTSFLIVVSVVVETIKQIEGQLVMRSYEEGLEGNWKF